MKNQELTGYIKFIKAILLFTVFFMFVVFVSGQTQIEQDVATKMNTKEIVPNLIRQKQQPKFQVIVPPNLKRIQTVDVPQLEGRNFNKDKIAALLDRIGLKLGRVLPIASNQNVGLVITQNPTARTRVNPQTTINLTYGVEEAPEVVDVPQYIGLYFERAVGRMPNDRLSPGNMREVNSDQPPGIVVNQFPEVGMQVDPGTEVALDISIGPPEIVTVTVPRLTGFSLEEAAEKLRQAGLFAGELSDQPMENNKSGIVIDQSPREGEIVNKGSAVNITYTIAVAETRIVVPNVTGLWANDAIRILKENRLNYARDFVRNTNQPPGIVIGQDVQAGQRVKPGSIVVIQIQDRSLVPPWVYWGGGALIAGLLGGLARKFSTGKKKKYIGEREVKVNLKPVWDTGTQTVISGDSEVFQNKIFLKYIPDLGVQTINNN